MFEMQVHHSESSVLAAGSQPARVVTKACTGWKVDPVISFQVFPGSALCIRQNGEPFKTAQLVSCRLCSNIFHTCPAVLWVDHHYSTLSSISASHLVIPCTYLVAERVMLTALLEKDLTPRLCWHHTSTPLAGHHNCSRFMYEWAAQCHKAG